MGTNQSVNRNMPTDAEIDRDVAELRRLVAGLDGPPEPHPAYWQNFVVRVHERIDHKKARRWGFRFSPAWASLGGLAVVTVIVVGTGLLKTPPTPPQPLDKGPVARVRMMDLSSSYDETDTQALILSKDDLNMISAIESDRDDAVFEALVAANAR